MKTYRDPVNRKHGPGQVRRSRSPLVLAASLILQVHHLQGAVKATGEPGDKTDVVSTGVYSREFPVPGKLMVSKEDLRDFSDDRLVELMGHDLPWTRLAAAHVLADKGASSVAVFQKTLTHDDWRVVRAGQDGLIALLKAAQEGKDDALREAVLRTMPVLEETLKNEHYYVRMGALDCFKAMGADAKAAIDDICVSFNDEDFLGVAPRAAAVVGAIGVGNVDPAVLMPVLKEAVRSVNMSVRSPAINLIAKLSEEQKRELIPDMIHALKTPMRDGYTRFQVQGRVAAVLEELKVEEVLPLMVAILNQSGWGEGHRIETFLPKIMTYGDKAAAAIPAIEKNMARLRELRRDNKDNKGWVLLTEAMEKLEGGAE